MLNLKFSRENDMVKGLSKRDEDAGQDLYINPVWFDSVATDGLMILEPGDVCMFDTGIRTVFSDDYVAIIHERGSTGSRCMATRCGVIDSGYRGVWNVMLNNTGKRNIVIYNPDKIDAVKVTELYGDIPVTLYPITKAIAQVVFQKVPKANLEEVSVEDILSVESERGSGKLGSSGK